MSLGFSFLAHVSNEIKVQLLCFFMESIADYIEEPAAEVYRGPVAEVPSLLEVHAHDLIPGF